MEDIEQTSSGFVAGMAGAAYHAREAMSYSRLKVLRDQSPAHLRHQLDHPEEPAPAMVLGQWVHACVLEPARWDAEYAPGPPGDRRTKEYRAALEELRRHQPGAQIVPADEYARCLAIRECIRAHRGAHGVLAQGQHELSAFWRDPQTGMDTKARFDSMTQSLGAIVDLKTTVDAGPAAFERSIYRFGYYLQAALYVEGARLLDLPILHYVIIAVEKDPPYAVGCYRLLDDVIRAGDEELKPLKDLYARCALENKWPGYPQTVEDLSLPRWAWRELDR